MFSHTTGSPGVVEGMADTVGDSVGFDLGSLVVGGLGLLGLGFLVVIGLGFLVGLRGGFFGIFYLMSNRDHKFLIHLCTHCDTKR